MIYASIKNGELQPLGFIRTIEDIDIEKIPPTKDDFVMFNTISSFSATISDCYINQRLLFTMMGISNNRLKRNHKPMFRKLTKERK